MRSRDGNNCFTFPVQLVLILLYSLSLPASEYLISYRYVVKNAIIYNEELAVSKAMQKCSGSPYETLSLEIEKTKNLKKILLENYEDFFSYIHKIGLNVSHKGSTINYENSSTTILTLKTTCFKVDFNDNFVKISALKQ
jgi:hypothetical protein